MMNQGDRLQNVWPAGVPRHIDVHSSIDEYLRQQIIQTPDAIAIDFYGYEMRYHQLDNYINRCASALLFHGIQKGDRVALYMQNCPQFVFSFFAILRAGAVAVSLNPMLRGIELGPILQKIEPKAIIVQTDLMAELHKITEVRKRMHIFTTDLASFVPPKPKPSFPAELVSKTQHDPETIDLFSALENCPALPVEFACNLETDIALLQMTGGTTGSPKAAIITHKAFAIAVVAAKLWYYLSPSDTTLGIAPFFHIMGLQVSMAPTLIAGGKLVILSRFNPKTTARVLSEKKCSNFFGPPTMLNAIVNLPDIEIYDLSSMRFVGTGGSPISQVLQQQMQRFFPNSHMCEGYGMTEVLALGGAASPIGRWKPGFVGIPVLSKLKIMDLKTGKHEMPTNKEGEIFIKGPTVMAGYWKQPEETKNSFSDDGWFATGDTGMLDEEGYLKILDRKKSLILCGGFNVYPSDVENILNQHPAIQEVAVIGVPDDYRGESPKAFVVITEESRENITKQDIFDWCKENMSAYKRPREVEFREQLPKSAAGKILKSVLARTVDLH